MKNYRIKTNVTMKEYNFSKYWIDSNIIPTFYNNGENLKTILNKYIEYVRNECYIGVSDNAIKNKQPMFINTEKHGTIQIGYVMTGSTYIENTKQYIDLWIEITEETIPNFKSEV